MGIVQLKKAKEEEERSKEQRRATLAATRRPGAACAAPPAASAEAATPSTSHPGECPMQSSRTASRAELSELPSLLSQLNTGNLFLGYLTLSLAPHFTVPRKCHMSGIAAFADATPVLPCCAEAQTPASRLMPSASQSTPAESVGSAWVPDAASALRRPAADGWPSNGFGRVLDEGVDLRKHVVYHSSDRHSRMIPVASAH